MKANSWTLPQTDVEAEKLEKEHVHRVYEDIADHFSGTRYKPWPRVVDFLMDQPSHSLMVDVGCGNGKCLGINNTMFEVGCDYSTNLISICRNRGFQSCVADVNCLPFRSNAVDVVLCIAVIHHMATQKRRHKALSELVRVLRPGGKALIYVWAMEQHFNKTESKYISSNRQKQMEAGGFANSGKENTGEDNIESIVDRVKDTSIVSTKCEEVSDETHCPSSNTNNSSSKTSAVLQSESETSSDTARDEDRSSSIEKDKDSSNNVGKPLKVHVNRTQFQEQDMLVPWQLKGKEKANVTEDRSSVFHRFYHVFKQGELEELCQTVPKCAIHQSYHDQGNWCVVLEKL